MSNVPQRDNATTNTIRVPNAVYEAAREKAFHFRTSQILLFCIAWRQLEAMPAAKLEKAIRDGEAEQRKSSVA